MLALRPKTAMIAPTPAQLAAINNRQKKKKAGKAISTNQLRFMRRILTVRAYNVGLDSRYQSMVYSRKEAASMRDIYTRRRLLFR